MTGARSASVPGNQRPTPIRLEPCGADFQPEASPLGWSAWLPLGLAVSGIAFVCLACLPPGICFGDHGELQLAAASLGISHPPGYPVYVTLCHFATWIPGIDPPYAVSVACLVGGLAGLLICGMIQVRLGVNPWIAAASIVLLSLYPRVRLNLIAPEVYGLTLLFLAAAAYLLMRYAMPETRGGQRFSLPALAALFFGIASVSRPPILLAAPFFLAAWWLAGRRSQRPAPRRPRSLGCLIGFFLLPAVYSLAYLLIRDRPNTGYDYIENASRTEQRLPPQESGLGGRIDRAIWLATGRQFVGEVGIGSENVSRRVAWMIRDVSPYHPITFPLVAALTVAGAAIVFRRSVAAGLFLTGMAFQSAAFVCVYPVHGQAADLMPLLFAGAICCGAVVSWAVARTGALREVIAIALFVAVSGGLAASFRSNPCNPAWIDASGFAAGIDLAVLPANSVILATWSESIPLRYVQFVRTPRADVAVVTARSTDWALEARRYAARPLFATRNPGDHLPEFDAIAMGGLWRLEKKPPSPSG